MKIFNDRSLQLVSKKVSVYSGDIRRVLQVTKRAIEICRDCMKASCKKDIMVSIDHVIKAFDELKQSKTVHALSGLRKFEIIVLIALYQQNLE